MNADLNCTGSEQSVTILNNRQLSKFHIKQGDKTVKFLNSVSHVTLRVIVDLNQIHVVQVLVNMDVIILL